jgi:hypothetical protein
MKKLIILSFIFLISGCSISKNVNPVDSTVSIKKIYVLNNESVHMKELVNEIVSQVKEQGFESESYSGDRPSNASHYITYTANWTWDIAMYLTYFKATLYEDGRVLGDVEYDSKMGGANLEKFGPTAEKIRPLLAKLLAKVQRPTY